MKIAFLTPTLELHGGNLVMLRYAEHLASHGHEVTIISPESPTECPMPDGVQVSCFGKLPSRLVSYSCQLTYLPAVVRALDYGFDVVVPIYSPLAVHCAFARRWLKAPFKVILFYQDFFEMMWTGNYIKFMLGRQRFVRSLDKVIAVSHGIAQEFSNVAGVSPVVIPNGIDDLFFEKQDVSKQRYVLFVGRPGKSKGFHVFEKAMALVAASVPDVKGLLVSSAVEDGALGNIQTVRYRNRAQLKTLYAEALIYAHAAIGESFGLPPLEAMASGTATVITRTAGTNDYTRNGHNCLVTEYGDHESLAQKILRLIKDDKLRHDMEDNGRSTAAAYRWENSLERFEDELAETVHGDKAPKTVRKESVV